MAAGLSHQRPRSWPDRTRPVQPRAANVAQGGRHCRGPTCPWAVFDTAAVAIGLGRATPDRAVRGEPRHRGGAGAGSAAPPAAGRRRTAPAADPDPRGNRHRQGSARGGDSPGRAAGRRPVRRRQLRRYPRDPSRGGAVRVRAGSVHGRPAGQGGALPGGAPGGAVPRRGRAPAGGPAGEAPQGAGGADGAAAREHAERGGGRLAPGRDERGLGRGRPRPALPGRSLPPAGRRHAAPAAAPGAGRGYPPPGRALPEARLRGLRAAAEDPDGRGTGDPPRLPVARERAGARQRDGTGGAARGGDRRDAGDSRVAAPPQSWRDGSRRRRGAARCEGDGHGG